MCVVAYFLVFKKTRKSPCSLPHHIISSCQQNSYTLTFGGITHRKSRLAELGAAWSQGNASSGIVASIKSRSCVVTFVEPAAEPVEDHALFACRHQADRPALHRGAVVDVVLENEDLQEPDRENFHKTKTSVSELIIPSMEPLFKQPAPSRGVLVPESLVLICSRPRPSYREFPPTVRAPASLLLPTRTGSLRTLWYLHWHIFSRWETRIRQRLRSHIWDGLRGRRTHTLAWCFTDLSSVHKKLLFMRGKLKVLTKREREGGRRERERRKKYFQNPDKTANLGTKVWLWHSPRWACRAWR